jgi:gamma-glutamylcysteine synthetase
MATMGATFSQVVWLIGCSCDTHTSDQVNLDYESEADMIEKFQIGLALQPMANALFASSPFKDGKPTGYVAKVAGWHFLKRIEHARKVHARFTGLI